ncbi:hypothetical protein KL943_003919 [Ogataea angusta]|nr:hypothetical protein KL943_003919 [Ogataea angusta]
MTTRQSQVALICLKKEFLSGAPEERPTKLLINGQYAKLAGSDLRLIFHDQSILELCDIESLGHEQLRNVVDRITDKMISVSEELSYFSAILLLQIFVQTNFTGPKLPLVEELGFLTNLTASTPAALSLLSLSGQRPNKLVDWPMALILSLRLFEKLQRCELSLIGENQSIEPEAAVSQSNVPELTEANHLQAALCWWRARALQVQQSLFHDQNPVLSTLTFSLLCPPLVAALMDNTDVNTVTNQYILVLYHLERSRAALSAGSETQAAESLAKAKSASGLQFVLTGCKAKRTKFQEKAFAALAVLARSQDTLLRAGSENRQNPQEVALNDDLFLERLQYENLGDDQALEELGDEKRVKIDFPNYESTEDQESRLLPIAAKEEDIPAPLRSLDPNSQPPLADLDSVQLLLRLETIRANSPANNALVGEELRALVERVLFSPPGSVNWLVFSNALWQRSLLETTRPKTVERGVLQLYSLVEELGVHAEQTARLFPKTKEEEQFPEIFTASDLPDDTTLINAVRSQYIYALSLSPKWSLDSRLAEKLIELGSVKSALEIYERLQLWTDAALCYGSIGNEKKAEELVLRQLAETPDDARALCVLGDVRQDPALWEKAWQLGRYANAKRSLAKYHYRLPDGSRDYAAAIGHQYDCVRANPLSFENWYFYGCLGLETENYELAAEAFTRCVALDDGSQYSWSNLASALLQLDKLKEAFTALQRAVSSGDTEKASWKIWENYLIVAVKLGRWDDVLLASRTLLDTRKLDGDGSLDIPILEKLAALLVSEPYDEDARQTHFQRTCLKFLCQEVPAVVNYSARVWRIVAKVDLWRKKPWLALEDYEKVYRAAVSRPELEVDQDVWREAVTACEDLVSAYENFGELPGKHNAGDVVCKDWRFKARSTVRSLLSKGKVWEHTEEYVRLQELRDEMKNK